MPQSLAYQNTFANLNNLAARWRLLASTRAPFDRVCHHEEAKCVLSSGRLADDFGCRYSHGNWLRLSQPFLLGDKNRDS